MKQHALPMLAVAGATLTTAGLAADASDVSELISRIKSKDDAVRGPAWQGAGPLGAKAVAPLAEVMTDADFETARCARRALEKIVRYAGRPGADSERQAAQAELVKQLKHASVGVRRHVAWMLSEIGDDTAVGPLAALLSDPEAREDARCALERIPGPGATAALRQGLAAAPEPFKFALANSLRVRGEKVDGYPSQKLVPTKQTSLKAG